MGRRGSGSVKERAGHIQLDFRYKGVRCRETLKLPPTKANVLYAERLLATIHLKIEKGTFEYSRHFPDSPRVATFQPVEDVAAITIKTALWNWFNRARKVKAWQPTYERRVSITIENQIVPVLGALDVADIDTAQIETWLLDLDLSNARLNDLMTPLRGAYKLKAVRQRLKSLDKENPVDDIPHYKVIVERAVDPFEPDEVNTILREMEKRSPEVARYYQFAFWTGLRPSELNAIKWSDVDFRKQLIRVQRKRYRGVDYDRTKTDESRNVDLLEPALDALKSLKREKPQSFLKGEHIFHNPTTSAPWFSDKSPREVYWYPALKKAGIRQRAPHQCRHTYASWMLSAEENPAWVAEQMGDNLKTIIKHYGRYMRSMNTGAGSKALKAYEDATKPKVIWSQDGHKKA